MGRFGGVLVNVLLVILAVLVLAMFASGGGGGSEGIPTVVKQGVRAGLAEKSTPTPEPTPVLVNNARWVRLSKGYTLWQVDAQLYVTRVIVRQVADSLYGDSRSLTQDGQVLLYGKPNLTAPVGWVEVGAVEIRDGQGEKIASTLSGDMTLALVRKGGKTFSGTGMVITSSLAVTSTFYVDLASSHKDDMMALWADPDKRSPSGYANIVDMVPAGGKSLPHTRAELAVITEAEFRNKVTITQWLIIVACLVAFFLCSRAYPSSAIIMAALFIPLAVNVFFVGELVKAHSDGLIQCVLGADVLYVMTVVMVWRSGLVRDVAAAKSRDEILNALKGELK